MSPVATLAAVIAAPIPVKAKKPTLTLEIRSRENNSFIFTYKRSAEALTKAATRPQKEIQPSVLTKEYRIQSSN